MWLDVVIIVLGFVGLIWGADKFVFGASAMARNLGVRPLLIGLTIVALGTSAPEIFSSAVAALDGKPDLAIGNALGSNIFNIGMALGVALLVRPMRAPVSLLRKELPALMLVTVTTGVLFWNFFVGPVDAFILIIIAAYFGYVLLRDQGASSALPHLDEEELASVGTLRAAAWLLLGLALLVLSAKVLVTAATSIAETLGVSTAIIGLTVVALGTSLPELAATVTCALKGQHELAIGNIIGSNILNILAVLPFPGLISPDDLDPDLMIRDYSTMLLLTLLLSWVCYLAIKGNGKLGRLSGLSFVLIYAAWLGYMIANL